jgi:hypothetical protein
MRVRMMKGMPRARRAGVPRSAACAWRQDAAWEADHANPPSPPAKAKKRADSARRGAARFRPSTGASSRAGPAGEDAPTLADGLYGGQIERLPLTMDVCLIRECGRHPLISRIPLTPSVHRCLHIRTHYVDHPPQRLRASIHATSRSWIIRKLKLESLQVESFETTGTGLAARGTVAGNAASDTDIEISCCSECIVSMDPPCGPARISRPTRCADGGRSHLPRGVVLARRGRERGDAHPRHPLFSRLLHAASRRPPPPGRACRRSGSPSGWVVPRCG